MQDLPRPVPGSGEALLRVRTVGICGTDIELLRGYYGFEGIAGHEITAEVIEAEDATLLSRRACVDINAGCGDCPECVGGDERHCPQRKVFGIRNMPGGFAEYAVAPVRNLRFVPPHIPDEIAVFAEPLASALRIREQIESTPRTRIGVLGDGKLGLLSALVLRDVGRVRLLGRRPEHLAIAAAQGVETGVIPHDTTPEAAAATHGSFDVLVEATGRADGLKYAVVLTRPQGTIVLKTTIHDQTNLNLAAVAVNELRILGSRCGDTGEALRVLESGSIDVRPLLEATYPLTEFAAALEHAQRPGMLKVLLTTVR